MDTALPAICPHCPNEVADADVDRHHATAARRGLCVICWEECIREMAEDAADAERDERGWGL